jgi:hypothetical protein
MGLVQGGAQLSAVILLLKIHFNDSLLWQRATIKSYENVWLVWGASGVAVRGTIKSVVRQL